MLPIDTPPRQAMPMARHNWPTSVLPFPGALHHPAPESRFVDEAASERLATHTDLLDQVTRRVLYSPRGHRAPNSLSAGSASAWWVFALSGVLALAFPLLVLVQPPLALWTLAALLGATIVVDGMFQMAAAFSFNRSAGRWLKALAAGILATGLLALTSPPKAAWGLVGIVSLHAALVGTGLRFMSRQTRGQLAAPWGVFVLGALFMELALFTHGNAVLSSPYVAHLAATWFAVTGVLRLLMAWELTHLRTEPAWKQALRARFQPSLSTRV